jgi:hypothetical protein
MTAPGRVPSAAPAPLLPVLVNTSRLLDWRDRSHWSPRSAPCRWCHRPSRLLDSTGRASHKVCAEAHGGT